MHRIFLTTVCFLLAALAGCETYEKEESFTVTPKKPERLLVFVLDTSGSFIGQMSENGLAYRLFLRSAEQFFRGSVGSDDHILLCQLSADKETLLWEGTPLNLKSEFPNANALRTFLAGHSNPDGSRVCAACADTIDYVVDLPGVNQGDTQVIVVIASDMEENDPAHDVSVQKLNASLKRFAGVKGSLAFFGVKQDFIAPLRRCVERNGVKHCTIDAGFVRDVNVGALD